MANTFDVFLDYDNDGAFDAADEITSKLKRVDEWRQGIAMPLTQRVATPGRLVLTLDNTDKRFSPAWYNYLAAVKATSPANLIGYWPINDSTGSKAQDHSNNGRNGTIYGVTLGADGIGDYNSDGVFTAGTFDGINDYIDIYSAGLAGAFNPDALTVLVWGRVTGTWTDATGRVLVYLGADTDQNRLYFLKDASGYMNWAYEAGNVLKTQSDATGLHLKDLSADAWFCLAMTVSTAADQLIAYYNGAQWREIVTGLGTWAGALNSEFCNIGAKQTTPSVLFDGDLAHMALWDTVLTPAQISALYRAYAGRPVPNLPIRVRSTDGVDTWTVFRGVTLDFEPTPDVNGAQECRLTCTDHMGVLQADTLSVPLFENVDTDDVISAIVNETYAGEAASGYVLTSGGGDINTCTINGQVYTFADPLVDEPYNVLEQGIFTAQNLRAAINAEDGAGTKYGTGTARNNDVEAQDHLPVVDPIDPRQIDLYARVKGTTGNAITLEKDGAHIAISGATLSGGTDAPSGLTSFQAGEQTVDIAGDQWDPDTTSALQAIKDVVNAEQGFFFAARDGTLTFLNKDWQFLRAIATPAITVDNTHSGQSGGQYERYIFNRVIVTYTPRNTDDVGVVARSNTPIRVLANSGTQRFSPIIGWPGSGYTGAPSPGDSVVRIPFVDVDTGSICGAKDVLPLTPTTDYIVRPTSDPTSDDLTFAGFISGSFVVTGSGVEISLQNSCVRDMYVHDLQIRGTRLLRYDDQTVISENAASIAAYNRKPYRIRLALTTNENFARSIGNYELGRFKNPVSLVPSIIFRGDPVVNGVNVFSLDLGDIITLSEDQTGIAAQMYAIMGFRYGVNEAGTVWELECYLRSISDKTYWILGDATYGVLGYTTRLAI